MIILSPIYSPPKNGGQYKIPFKAQTIGPKMLKSGLKLSQINTLDDPMWSSIKKTYKTQNIGPKKLEYGLKWSQENTLDDTLRPQTI